MGLPHDRLISPQELADFLSVPLATIYQWRHKNYGPTGVRVGRHIRYSRESVLAFVQQQADAPRPAA